MKDKRIKFAEDVNPEGSARMGAILVLTLFLGAVLLIQNGCSTVGRGSISPQVHSSKHLQKVEMKKSWAEVLHLKSNDTTKTQIKDEK